MLPLRPPAGLWECVMSSCFEELDAHGLDARLCSAPMMTAELLSDVVDCVCTRFSLLRHTAAAARAEQMIQSGAWTDAVLALLAVELPQWQLRRLAYDVGEWHCALSCQREMPEWLDKSIEAHHADLPLAILRAFLGVQLMGEPAGRRSVPEVVRASVEFYQPMCCDNFD